MLGIQKEPTVESVKGISCQCSKDRSTYKSIYSGLILSWRVIHNTFCHEREMKEWEWQAEPNSFFARIPHNFFVAFISTLSASSFLKIFSHFGRCSKLSIPFLLLLPGFSPVVVSGDYCLLWTWAIHTVHGVPKARILKWFTIPISSGPCFVRTLHHDPSILGGPTWHGS